MKKYPLDDLHIVNVDEPFIALQESLFGCGGAICDRIAEGARFLGAREVRTGTLSNWNIVWALDDWFFLSRSDDALREETLFSRLVRFPEAGANECRFEVAARIFLQLVPLGLVATVLILFRGEI